MDVKCYVEQNTYIDMKKNWRIPTLDNTAGEWIQSVRVVVTPHAHLYDHEGEGDNILGHSSSHG